MHPVLASALAMLREALLDAWALLQPVDCLGCGRPDRAVCADCRAAIRPLVPRPIRCDAALRAPVWTAADYAGPVRGAILALKEHGRIDAARRLAPLLLAAVRGAAEGGGASDRPELVRVPTTRRALLRRGLDPLAELLRAAGLRDSPVLRARRTWAAAAQKSRDRAGRLDARRGRFRARGPLAGRAFLLVDDVATTGATLAAAAQAIEAVGGRVLACAVLAAPELERRSVLRVHEAVAMDSVMGRDFPTGPGYVGANSASGSPGAPGVTGSPSGGQAWTPPSPLEVSTSRTASVNTSPRRPTRSPRSPRAPSPSR